MKMWFQKKFKSLMKAGIKYFGLNLILPVGIPVIAIIIAIIFALLEGVVLKGHVLKNIFINVTSEIMYFSIITFIMICKYIVKNNEEKKDFLQNGDFWISLIMSIIFMFIYGIQVHSSILINSPSNVYAITTFIVMIIMLYFAISINSEYCDDSNSSGTNPAVFANNRKNNDDNGTSWESKL